MRMPIHPGPPHRSSCSSSSSDFSSNRRTTNTSPSVSPNESGEHRLPSRKPSPERIKSEDESRYARGGSSAPSSSPYASFLSHTPPSGQWNDYGPQPLDLRHLPKSGYASSPPAVIPSPGYSVAPGPYIAYSGPPSEIQPFPSKNGQQNYALGFQNVDAGEPSSKKRRGNLPRWKTDLMKRWYEAHIKNPYPNDQEKRELMAATDLTLEQ
ncbi:MAG: hypothetical protein Q9191_008155, partial [Dirinaria sp. TL-2023a]